MNKDTALLLKIDLQNGKNVSKEHADKLLSQSSLFQQLVTDFEISMMPLLWRLTQLSEIPFSHFHPKVKEWLHNLVELTYTDIGFTYTGEENDMLPCYNAMISSLLIKMKYPDQHKINKGIDWIIKYQPFSRNCRNKWHGTTCTKYGGCLKSTPCYIGVVKSVIALSDYKLAFDCTPEINKKLKNGLEYILDHQLYLRKSKDTPITKDITVLSFPFTWRTNIIELLRLMKDNQLLEDPRTTDAKNFLLKRKKNNDYWHTRSVAILKKPYWIKFDHPGQQGFWISNEIEQLL